MKRFFIFLFCVLFFSFKGKDDEETGWSLSFYFDYPRCDTGFSYDKIKLTVQFDSGGTVQNFPLDSALRFGAIHHFPHRNKIWRIIVSHPGFLTDTIKNFPLSPSSTLQKCYKPVFIQFGTGNDGEYSVGNYHIYFCLYPMIIGVHLKDPAKRSRFLQEMMKQGIDEDKTYLGKETASCCGSCGTYEGLGIVTLRFRNKTIYEYELKKIRGDSLVESAGPILELNCNAIKCFTNKIYINFNAGTTSAVIDNILLTYHLRRDVSFIQDSYSKNDFTTVRCFHSFLSSDEIGKLTIKITDETGLLCWPDIFSVHAICED